MGSLRWDLLIRDASWLVTMDQDRRVIENGWALINEGTIQGVGSGSPPDQPVIRTIRARDQIVLPGLINTHHHMFQNLARAYTPVANLPLLPWLTGHLPLWRELRRSDLLVAAKVAMAELMLSGCTLTVDHHYVYPKSDPNIIDALFEAAQQMGIRIHACRGAMDLPTVVVAAEFTQTTAEVLRDFERVFERWHDPHPGSRRQVSPAPCGLFGVTAELLRESANFASAHGLRLHTHCGETEPENQLALVDLGSRPLDYFAQQGWGDERVWFAHGIHFTDEEINRLVRLRIGIAHCPCSNMRLGSGVCQVKKLRSRGAVVSLGVDGSASNDSGHLLNEVRQSLLLARVVGGADAMTPMEALEMATREGARNLGRLTELGSIEVGKYADLAIFPSEELWSNGAENPVDALVLCFPRLVDTLIVHGVVCVDAGELIGVDLTELRAEHRTAARRLQTSV